MPASHGMPVAQEPVWDFSDMDTTVYRDASQKYLPHSIQFLFVPESPPAFRDEQKMTFFYFANSRSDLFFSNMMRAIFHVDYKKSPKKKRAC